ncbi:MAG: type II toxin-antitoxin system RelE/ParE family toxin [Clostridia bacterium]
MSKWSVVYSNVAKQDLSNIYQYIAFELIAPETARKQSDRIMTAIEMLEEMPMRCSLCEKEPWKTRGLKKLLIDNFIVFFLPIEKVKEVLIVTIMYSGRNVDDILAKLDI